MANPVLHIKDLFFSSKKVDTQAVMWVKEGTLGQVNFMYFFSIFDVSL